MSSAQPLDAQSIRQLPTGSQIVIVSKDSNEVIERVTYLRFAGHYRAGAGDVFAVKDAHNKFRLRSERELGCTADSTRCTFLADDLDGIDLNSETIIDLVGANA